MEPLDPKIQPNMVEGLGLCAEDGCPSFDGKRCRVMGFRPDRFCEPWVKWTRAEVERLRGENERLRERDADNEAIFEWLQGAASYRGDWFPEKPEGGKPYWWRSHLRKKLETRRG